MSGRVCLIQSPLACLLFLMASACGLFDAMLGSEDKSPARKLDPFDLVATEHYASPPDTSWNGGITNLVYHLPSSVLEAIEQGAVVEAVLEVEPGSVWVSGWVEEEDSWMRLISGEVAGTDAADVWWQAGWVHEEFNEDLVGSDGAVRLGAYNVVDVDHCILRVIDLSPGLMAVPGFPGRAPLAASGDELAVIFGSAIYLFSTSGEFLRSIGGTAPPSSFGRAGDYYYGSVIWRNASFSEIKRVSVEGGVWERVTYLPWTTEGRVAATSDGRDLFLIYFPGSGQQYRYPTIYTIFMNSLIASSDFGTSVMGSMVIELEDLDDGEVPAFAWWERESRLVITGSRNDAFGFLTFNRSGQFRDFFQIPFVTGSLKMAFIGDYLFIGGARPTLEAVGWTLSYRPDPPVVSHTLRWTVP